MTDIQRYSQMQKEFYRSLAEQSDYASYHYTSRNDGERVVGHYAMNELYDYEGPLLAGIDKTEQMLALEYGCGPGRMLARLAPKFRRIDGVDLSAEVLKVAEKHCATMPTPPQLYNNDGNSLTMIADSTYDLTYSVICLQHICVHSIRKQIMSEVFRVLKQQGIFTFQMGYGTGHQQPTPYDQNFTNASGTNGANDVMVLHPWEPIKDLIEIGFREISFCVQPICPGDSHSAWIFLQARKTSKPSLRICSPFKEFTKEELESSYNYFTQIYSQFSISQKITGLEDQLLLQSEQLKVLKHRCLKEEQRNAELQQERQEHQQQMVRNKLRDILQICRQHNMKLALFGAGKHTDMLFQETLLQPADVAVIYDNNTGFWGKQKAQVAIKNPARLMVDIPDILLVSSKAFASEIEQQIRPLLSDKTLLVNLYPTNSQ